MLGKISCTARLATTVFTSLRNTVSQQQCLEMQEPASEARGKMNGRFSQASPFTHNGAYFNLHIYRTQTVNSLDYNLRVLSMFLLLICLFTVLST
jgi:hypothetical protein